MATSGSFDLASFGSSLSFSFQSTICGNFVSSSPLQIKFQDQQIYQYFFEQLKTSNVQQLCNYDAANKLLQISEKILIKQALNHWKTLIVAIKQQKQQTLLKGIHKLTVFMNKKLNYEALKCLIKMRELSSIIFEEKQRLKNSINDINQKQNTFQFSQVLQEREVFNTNNPEHFENIFKNKNQISSSNKSLDNLNIQTQISINNKNISNQKKSPTYVTSMDKMKDSDSFNSLFKYLQKSSIKSHQQQIDHIDTSFELSQSILLKQIHNNKTNSILKCLQLQFQKHSILNLPKQQQTLLKGIFVQNPKSNMLIHQRPDQQYTTLNDHNDTTVIFLQNKSLTNFNMNSKKLLLNSKSVSKLKVDSNKNNNEFIKDKKSNMKSQKLLKKEYNQVLVLKHHHQRGQVNDYKSLNQNNRYFSSLKKQSNNEFLHKLIDHKRQELKEQIEKKHGIRCFSKINSLKPFSKYDKNNI